MKKMIIILAAVIVLIVIISLPGPAAQLDYDSILTPQTQNLAGVQTKSIIEETDNYVIGVHIPQTNNAKLNQLLNIKAHQAIGKFKNDVAALIKSGEAKDGDIYVLHLDCTVFRHSSDLLSVVLHQATFLADGIWHKMLSNINYRLSDNSELSIRDIFKPNSAAINYLYRYCSNKMKDIVRPQKGEEEILFANGIFPKESNYDLFALTVDGLVIYFDYGQLADETSGYYSLLIPYQALAPDLLLTKEGLIKPVIIDPKRPMVALTFDDGPHSKWTPLLLDALKKREAKATFFVLGNRVEGLPYIAKRAVAEGHSVNIHSYNHIGEFTKMSDGLLAEHIRKTSKAIIAASGQYPYLVRPPYGSINKDTAAKIKLPIILWNKDPLDWKYRDSQKVTKNILAQVKDGDIILLHDIYPSSVNAAVAVIDALRAKGYQFVTIEDLFRYKNISLEAGGIYRKGV
ncbi:MAG: polysaccharide deacetylase family protein [Bacillota bacterium]|jgi:peptidoglycan/xylan/chitin deacetylase (PgdA/CDA1 family)